MKSDYLRFTVIFLAMTFLSFSTTIYSADYHKSADGATDGATWGYGITPGIFLPADKDFDSSSYLSIGGLLSYRKCNVRMLELEAHYSSMDVDSAQLPTGSTDTDATHWTIGLNALFKLGKNSDTIERGWHAGFGLHYNHYDLPATFIPGSDGATGIGGKLILGHRWNKSWQARVSYLLCGEGNAKAVSGSKFKRSGMEIQLSYLY